MARAPCVSEMAPIVGKRSQSDKNVVFIGVGNLLGWAQILYALECWHTIWNDVHLVKREILRFQLEGCSHRFFSGLEE